MISGPFCFLFRVSKSFRLLKLSSATHIYAREDRSIIVENFWIVHESVRDYLKVVLSFLINTKRHLNLRVLLLVTFWPGFGLRVLLLQLDKLAFLFQLLSDIRLQEVSQGQVQVALGLDEVDDVELPLERPTSVFHRLLLLRPSTTYKLFWQNSVDKELFYWSELWALIVAAFTFHARNVEEPGYEVVVEIVMVPEAQHHTDERG